MVSNYRMLALVGMDGSSRLNSVAKDDSGWSPGPVLIVCVSEGVELSGRQKRTARVKAALAGCHGGERRQDRAAAREHAGVAGDLTKQDC